MIIEKKAPKVLLTQIEDALEERQRLDRRQQDEGIPQDVTHERRKVNRRASRSKTQSK